jgi:hypothetical protein
MNNPTRIRCIKILAALVLIGTVGGISLFIDNYSKKNNETSPHPYAEVEKFLLSKFPTYREWNDAARKLGKEAVPALIHFLKNPRRDVEGCQSQCVGALGEIADGSATDALVNFFENASANDVGFKKGKSLSESDTLVALRNVPRAASKIAVQGDQEALRFLIKYANPGTWEQVTLPWEPEDMSVMGVNKGLWKKYWVREFIFMLGATGSPEARNALNQIRLVFPNTHYAGWATTALNAAKRWTFSQRISRLYRYSEGAEFKAKTEDLFWDILDWMRFHVIWVGLLSGAGLVAAIALIWLKVKKRPAPGLTGSTSDT